MRLDSALDETERRSAALDTSGWSALVDRLINDCHPEQRAFVLDDGRYISACIGRGGGKTTGGNVRFLRRMLTQSDARCVFIAKTRLHAKDLLWSETKQLFARLGFVAGRDITYNETSLTATLRRNGASLRLVGADKAADLDSLRGKTYHEVGIDEAASHTDALLDYLIREVIGMRLVGSLWLIGTAGKRLKGIFYEATRRGSKRHRPWSEREQHPGWKGWSSHKWSLKSAIEATKDRPIPKLLEIYAAQLEEIAANGYTDDNPVKRREFDGEWAADDTTNVYTYRIYHPETGELWNQWDPPRDGPLGIGRLPTTFDDWAHVISMDPGFTDPTAINVFSFSPSDPSRTIYHRLCFEQTALYAKLIAQKLIGEQLNHERPGGIIGALGEWPNGMIADPAHQMAKAILAELANVYGIQIEPAEKGFGYKVGAIAVVNGDLVDGRIKVLKGSKLEEQLLDLQWDESRTGELIERKSQPNHSTDCLVYGRILIGKFMVQQAGEPPPEAPPDAPPMPDEIMGSGFYREDLESLLG